MSRRKEFFPEVTDQQWNDWHWQVKNRIETVDELKKYIKLTAEEEEGIRESLKTLRMAITPYYLTLIDPENPHCPIRKQAIPTVEELKRSPADLEDPLHEDSDSPVPGLTPSGGNDRVSKYSSKCFPVWILFSNSQSWLCRWLLTGRTGWCLRFIGEWAEFN